MPDLFETADQRRSPAHLAARALSLHVDSGAEITRAMLNAVMDSAFGGTDAQGRWTQRDSFEVLEHALVLSYRRNERSAFARNDLDTAIVQASRLPTQTVRSEQQLDWQQFSTPIDLSAVAVLLAQAEASDIVLEPSAGNGLLVAQLPDVAELQLNELDPARRNRLSDAFPQTAVTGHDGATIASTLAAAKRPTLILMNPPFSRSLGRGGDHLAAVRHLSAAIKHLRGGGRIVAIMPDWFAPSARLRDVFEATLAPVTVRNSIRLEKAYTKHGTSIAVRLYTALKTPAPLLEQTGVYLAYRPSRITFDAAGEHPTALVESVAMGSIPAPIPDYVPNLPERTVSERMLSASQLETVVYAGHAWDQWLPGTYADAWAIIHRNMEAALEQTGIVDDLDGSTLNSGAKAAARSRFESCKQRFFGQVLLSMKLPTVIAAVEGHIADGKSVVLQLVTTAESILTRRLCPTTRHATGCPIAPGPPSIRPTTAGSDMSATMSALLRGVDVPLDIRSGIHVAKREGCQWIMWDRDGPTPRISRTSTASRCLPTGRR